MPSARLVRHSVFQYTLLEECRDVRAEYSPLDADRSSSLERLMAQPSKRSRGWAGAIHSGHAAAHHGFPALGLLLIATIAAGFLERHGLAAEYNILAAG